MSAAARPPEGGAYLPGGGRRASRQEGSPAGALVVLTQAAEGSESLARQLVAAGLQVEHWPLVRLAPVAAEAIEPVLRRLGDYDWILLPSPSAVRLVAGRMKALGIAWPVTARAGLVGPSSVEAFRECFGGQPAIDTPPGPPHDASHLIGLLPDLADQEGVGTRSSGRLRALVLNRPDGRTHWLAALERKAQSVDVVPAYAAEPVTDGPPPTLVGRLQRLRGADEAALWVVGAASHLDTLLQCLSGDLAAWTRRQPLLVPHAAILAHAQAAGFSHVVVYEDRRDLVERLQYLANRHGRTSPKPADQDADNKEPSEEPSALSLDQQKAAATPSARDDDKVSDAKVIGETPASATATGAKPAGTQAPGSAAATSASVPASAASPAPSPASPIPGSAGLGSRDRESQGRRRR